MIRDYKKKKYQIIFQKQRLRDILIIIKNIQKIDKYQLMRVDKNKLRMTNVNK